MMPTFNYAKFWEIVNSYRRVAPHWREGQMYYNALMAMDKSEAELINGSDNDPFYDDANIGRFLEYLQTL